MEGKWYVLTTHNCPKSIKGIFFRLKLWNQSLYMVPSGCCTYTTIARRDRSWVQILSWAKVSFAPALEVGSTLSRRAQFSNTVQWYSIAEHRGSISASHPAARVWLPAIPRVFFNSWCYWDLSVALYTSTDGTRIVLTNLKLVLQTLDTRSQGFIFSFFKGWFESKPEYLLVVSAALPI